MYGSVHGGRQLMRESLAVGAEMPVIRSLRGLVLRVPGEPYSGWLPPGSAPTPGTATKDVELDLEIDTMEPPQSGFLLICSSSDPEFNGDTWHETLELAVQQAEYQYGVVASEWTLVRPPAA